MSGEARGLSVGQRRVAGGGGVGDLVDAEAPPRDQAPDGEDHPAAGAGIVSGLASVVPLDARGPGELQGLAVVEVEKEQGGLGIDGQVAEAVEQVVAL